MLELRRNRLVVPVAFAISAGIKGLLSGGFLGMLLGIVGGGGVGLGVLMVYDAIRSARRVEPELPASIPPPMPRPTFEALARPPRAKPDAIELGAGHGDLLLDRRVDPSPTPDEDPERRAIELAKADDLEAAIAVARRWVEAEPRRGRSHALMARLELLRGAQASAAAHAADALQAHVLADEAPIAALLLAAMWDQREAMVIDASTCLAIGRAFLEPHRDPVSAAYCFVRAAAAGAPAVEVDRLLDRAEASAGEEAPLIAKMRQRLRGMSG